MLDSMDRALFEAPCKSERDRMSSFSETRLKASSPWKVIPIEELVTKRSLA